jgi:hypothetical protein
MTPTLVLPSPVDLVASMPERCDGCGAAAKLGFRLQSGGELAFCGHHANRHAPDIARLAAQITMEADFAWVGVPRVGT